MVAMMVGSHGLEIRHSRMIQANFGLNSFNDFREEFENIYNR
jgi:hypothetical protein